MSIRGLARRIKRKLVRLTGRAKDVFLTGPRAIAREVKYWRSLQAEVLAFREDIRVLNERYHALSARTTMLQREIAPLHAAVDPAIERLTKAQMHALEVGIEVQEQLEALSAAFEEIRRLTERQDAALAARLESTIAQVRELTEAERKLQDLVTELQLKIGAA